MGNCQLRSISAQIVGSDTPVLSAQMEENLGNRTAVEQELAALRYGDLAQLEAQAKALGLPRVIVPKRNP